MTYFRPELILGGEHILDRVTQSLVELLIAGVSVCERRAAHHLAPVLASPAVILGVGADLELIDESRPVIGVEELEILNEAYRLIEDTRERALRARVCEETVGVDALFIDRAVLI